ncbi:DNA packaging Nu1 [Verticiella sediminum]|uniref:DNA packaging Nu1 n=2 Tax=Verticiella sediminum TaxID=1247510 RepID=A0A556AJP5_9BURK|nr:DNA packaging Nu1 [Verticiella sediminum]
MLDLHATVTQSEFGRIVGISQQAVSDLVGRGVLRSGEPVGVWLVEYCSHLREGAAGRLTAGDLDLATERARLASAQADKVEMANAVTRGELAPAHVIEEVLSRAGARVAGILDSIPMAVKRRVPELPASSVRYIEEEIARVRNIAASVSVADLQPQDIFADAESDGEPEAG